MKEETRNKLVFAVFMSVLIIIICVCFWFAVVGPEEQHKKLCYESMGHGEDYSFWNNNTKYRYRPVGRDHFNCCWSEVELVDDGYYTSEKCKGFKKEVVVE